MGLRRCLLVQERTDARRGLGAAHELGGGGRQFGDALEGRQRDEDDDSQEDLSEDPRGRLRDPDQERADNGDAHRAHVEAARERGQAGRAGQSGAQLAFSTVQRVACALQRARHGQLSGSLEDRERGRRDVGARVGSLALGQAYRAGDEGRGDDARDDEAKSEDDAGCRRDDGDDTDRAHADDRRHEGG